MATTTVTGPQGRPNSIGPPAGYFANFHKYYRVDNSISAEFLLLIGSYLHLDISLLVLYDFGWKINTHMYLSVLIFVLWTVGALVGYLIYGFGMTQLSNKRVNQIAASILLASGISLAAGYSSLIAINAGRFLAGCCSGMVYIPTVKRIGDNAPRTYRGALATKISMAAALGSILGFTTYVFESVITQLNVNETLGFVTSAFALAAVITSHFYGSESVVQLVKSGSDREAIDLLIKLRSESHETSEIRNEFDEVKAMVDEANAEAKLFPNNFLSGGNKKVVGLFSELKNVNAIVPNLPLQYILVLLGGGNFIVAVVILYPVLRMFSLFVPLFMIDTRGRRNLLLISAIGTSLSLLVLGTFLLGFYLNFLGGSVALWVTGLSACAVKIFASLGIDPMQHVYAAEAFPLAKRTKSIMFAICCEHSLQIGLNSFFVVSLDIGLCVIVTAGLFCLGIFFGGLFVYNRLPETRGLTLRQCHSAFNPSRSSTSGISSIGAAYGP